MKTPTQTPPNNPILEMVTETVAIVTVSGQTLVNTLSRDKNGLFYMWKGRKEYLPSELTLIK